MTTFRQILKKRGATIVYTVFLFVGLIVGPSFAFGYTWVEGYVTQVDATHFDFTDNNYINSTFGSCGSFYAVNNCISSYVYTDIMNPYGFGVYKGDYPDTSNLVGGATGQFLLSTFNNYDFTGYFTSAGNYWIGFFMASNDGTGSNTAVGYASTSPAIYIPLSATDSTHWDTSASPFSTTTRYTSFTYSTETQYARLRGYMQEGERIDFYQETSVMGREDQEWYIATTSDFFDYSFFFHGLPNASSTINKVIGLYSYIRQIDYGPTYDPFSNPFDKVVTLITSTSTIISTFSYDLPPIAGLQQGYSFAECSLGFGLTDSLPWFEFKGFDLGLCIADIAVALFVPLPDQVTGYITDLKENVYSRAPIGYITRFYELLSTTTATALPTIDYTFSTSSRSALAPILGGERIHFEPFEYATGTSITSITSDGANGLPEKNLWEIVEPFYTIVLGLILVIMIIHDLTNIHAHGEDSWRAKV